MRIAASTVLVLAVALAGCGGSKLGPDSNDKRGSALQCLTNKHKLPARNVPGDAIQVGDPRTGPKVQFYLTRGQAAAAQFQGTAEGSIQSGSVLIFVHRGGDKLLTKVEDCIDSL